MTKQEQKEFIVLKEDVKHIKKDVSEINTNVNEFNDTLTKLTSKMFNDEDTGEMGYFEITRRSAVRLTKLENIKIAFLGFIFFLGAGFWALVDWMSGKQ